MDDRRYELPPYRSCAGDAVRRSHEGGGGKINDEAAVHEMFARQSGLCASRTAERRGGRGKIDLEGACTSDDRSPCARRIALGVAHDSACALGLSSCPSLRAVLGGRYTSRKEADAILARWAAEVEASPGAPQSDCDWAAIVREEVLSS